MEYVSCGKGHFYDPNLYASCPQCAEEQRGGTVNGYGATQPVYPGGMETIPNGPEGAVTPTEPCPAVGGPCESWKEGPSQVQGYAPTAPVPFLRNDPAQQDAGANPVVGWLVCVSGPNKGGDYRIRNGYNYVGRSESMDICIQGDSYISSDKAAMISYDDEEREFFFGPGNGHNAVRVNGKMIHAPVQLQPYDELKIGMSLFRFVPFCGERFDWNEQK